MRGYAADGRLRSRRRHGRVEYNAADVERLAAELRAPAPSVALVADDERIAALERQLGEASQMVGYLRALVEERTLQRDEERKARALLVDKEREAAALAAELRALQRSGSTLRLIAIALLVALLLALAAVLYLSIRFT